MVNIDDWSNNKMKKAIMILLILIFMLGNTIQVRAVHVPGFVMITLPAAYGILQTGIVVGGVAYFNKSRVFYGILFGILSYFTLFLINSFTSQKICDYFRRKMTE
ncbi:MAG: hypothetical protein LBL71_04840 [Endomicrobium sp.]|jgi:uncharacterized membrane protein|nr:hypothetical protein [Endomicrobium sp.]